MLSTRMLEKITSAVDQVGEAVPGTERAVLTFDVESQTEPVQLATVISWEVFFGGRAREGVTDGATISTRPLTNRRVLEACPNLKVVSRMGVGVDSIDLAAAAELGILACNVPGVNTAEVADHAMAMLLALTRCLPDSIRTTREGAWSSDSALTVHYLESVRRIAGHTVGIIGFGDIGGALDMTNEGFTSAVLENSSKSRN